MVRSEPVSGRANALGRELNRHKNVHRGFQRFSSFGNESHCAATEWRDPHDKGHPCTYGDPCLMQLPGCAGRWPASCAVRQGSRLPYHYLGARAAGPHPALCGREAVCRTITWVRGPLPASCAVRQGSRLPYYYLGARAAGLHPALCGREAVCRTNKPSGVGVNHASCSPLPALAGRSGCGNRVL